MLLAPKIKRKVSLAPFAVQKTGINPEVPSLKREGVLVSDPLLCSWGFKPLSRQSLSCWLRGNHLAPPTAAVRHAPRERDAYTRDYIHWLCTVLCFKSAHCIGNYTITTLNVWNKTFTQVQWVISFLFQHNIFNFWVLIHTAPNPPRHHLDIILILVFW